MRIVLLSHEYPPFHFGGVGVFVKDLAHGLAQQGIDVTVVTGRPIPWKKIGNFNSPVRNGNPTVIRLNYPNITPRHTIFQLFNERRIVKIISELNPDVIHGQSGSFFPSVRQLKKIAPTIVTYHGSPFVQRNLAIQSLAKGGTIGDFVTFTLGFSSFSYTYQKELENSNAAVAVSKSLMVQLKSEMKSENHNLEFIHNGVDVNSFEGLPKASFEPELVFGGRLFWAKGVLNVVQLANLLKNKYGLTLKINVYGEGPLYKTMLRLKEKNNLSNLNISGFLERREFVRKVCSASFVLLPSFFEASPMVLLESMCFGKTVVMFDLPFSNEFTDQGKYAILAPTIERMAERIRDAYEDRFPQKMQASIRDFARQNFDITKTVKDYVKIYERISG